MADVSMKDGADKNYCPDCDAFLPSEPHKPMCPYLGAGCDPTNPKDLLGVKKVSVTKLPATAILHGAHAMMNGAEKYGPYNWRGKKVRASIYVDAAMRHLLSWFEGEEEADDSGVHHLGHVIACVAIILDAQTTGNLVDDRPIVDYVGAASFLLRELNQKVKEKANGTSGS